MYKCFAKINYTLNVLPKTHGELHKLCSIAPKINLFDEVSVKRNSTGKITISCTDKRVPTNSQNLVYKVLDAFNKYRGIKQGYSVVIKKNIPISSGLGGGSSDAAGALLEAMKLGDVHYGYYQLLEVVRGLGSDIPQFLVSDTTMIEGEGEEITPIEDKMDVFIVLVKPAEGVSAKEAYEAFDKYGISSEKDDSIITDLKNDNFEDAITKMNNDLEAPVLQIKPKLKGIKEKMKALGLPFVMMSGSGSCFFGLTKDKKLAEKVANHFEKKGYYTKVVEKATKLQIFYL